MEINEDNIVVKEVKEYSNRLRINLNKSDGFSDGQEVVILPKKQYDFRMQVKDNQIAEREKDIGLLSVQISTMKSEIEKLTIEKELLENQQNNLKEIIEDVVNPIHEQHKKELSAKDVEIKQLQMENKALKHKSSQLCIDIMDLSALQLIFTDKKKVLIDDFNKSISIVMPTDPITDTEKLQE